MTNFQWKNVNIPKIIAIFLLLVIFAEWLPYFLENVLFFMVRDFGDLGIIDIFQIGGVFFVPFISFVLIWVSRKFKNIILKLSNIVMVIALVLVIIFSWLYYLRFYQLWDFINNLIPMSPFVEIIGFHADLDPSMNFLFLWVNIILFYILVPVLIVIATDGNGFPQFDVNSDLALLIGGIYLTLRSGSFAGVPLRFALLSNICIAVILGSNIILKQNSVNNENMEFKMSKIPIGALLGTFMIIVFWFAAPGWLSNGYMFYSWTWIFLTIGVLLRWFLRQKSQWYNSRKIGSLSFLLLFIMIQMVVLSNIFTQILPILPIIIASALAVMTCFIPMSKFIFCVDQDYLARHKFMSHPIRFFFLSIFGLIGYLIPFLSCLFEPLTVLAAVILESIIFLIPFFIFLKFK